MIKLSSIVLDGNTQPYFSTLLRHGWTHPRGLRGEVLSRSVVKSFAGIQFQITQHELGRTYTAQYPTYTEVFIHSASNDLNSPILKGHGASLSVAETLGAIAWLAEELEQYG